MKKSSAITIIFLVTAIISFAASRFTDNGNGTITDNVTSLVWQKCSYGQSGNDCSTGSAAALQWDTGSPSSALSYCEDLSLGGRADWRLPNINELKSIIDYSKSNPAINVTYFPGTQSSTYWSSSVGVYGTTSAWNVTFHYGAVSSTNKTGTLYVRCVSGP